MARCLAGAAGLDATFTEGGAGLETDLDGAGVAGLAACFAGTEVAEATFAAGGTTTTAPAVTAAAELPLSVFGPAGGVAWLVAAGFATPAAKS